MFGKLVFDLAETFRAFTEATLDHASLVQLVARRLAEQIGDACVVWVARDDGAWLDPSAAQAHDAAATQVLLDALARHPARDGSGMTADVVRSGEPVLVAHIDPAELAARAEPAFADAVRTLGIRSLLSVPLRVRERAIGALSLFRYLPSSSPYNEYDRALVLTIADTAALVLANAQLVESMQREQERAKTYVALVENSSDMIAMADLDGRVRFVNAAGRALCGIDADYDVRQMTLASFHTEDGLKRAAIIRDKGCWQGEGVLRHQKTGELIATRINSFLIHDRDGRELGFATIQHDVRETKRLEADLRQAQKMEALGRLAGGVAHDFNNLLTVILSYCSMLARSLPADSRGATEVAQIDHAARRAADLTRQLLAFSRRQLLAPAPLDLGAAVQAMAGMIRRLIGEDIELRIATGADAGVVMVDAGQVEQVVMNLALNARDAMQQRGGVLTLETARAEPSVERPGAYTMLSISDTGVGMDEQTQAHLFEPFFTTKERGKGTGRGLSIVMGIVEQSGGYVTVDSTLEHGTTFRVFLPVTDDKPAPPPLVVGRVPAPVVGRWRVLVVEDEVEVRQLIRDVLRQAGYEVLDAHDGEHALRIAREVDIHLLLTDVIMPRMSGRELAARVAEVRPDARVLYMSGYADDKLGQHGVLDPGIALIPKPLTPETLLRRLREMLG